MCEKRQSGSGCRSSSNVKKDSSEIIVLYWLVICVVVFHSSLFSLLFLFNFSPPQCIHMKLFAS